MTKQEDPVSLFELLAENEELISRLYEAYAGRFPEHGGFWSALAGEEREHAAWLRDLGGKVTQGALYVDEDRFKREPIRLFRDYVQGELDAARGDEEIALSHALSVALSTEQALLERRFFEVFEADSAEMRHVLRELARATDEHVGRVRAEWSKHRR